MSDAGNYFIDTLRLNNFRNYSNKFFNFAASSYIICGSNGIGKTNILEAISLLSAGKGIRSSSTEDLLLFGENNCAIEGIIHSNLGVFNLGLAVDLDKEKNIFKKKYFLDNTQLKGNKLSEYYLNCIWLIPQMDNFFLQDNTNKRKLIDRLIFNFDKLHLSRVSQYERLIKERNKLLPYSQQQSKWLDIIEEKIVEVGVPLVISRLDFLQKINLITERDTKYPLLLSFVGEVEDLLQEHKYALRVENILKSKLAESRYADFVIGSTSLGAHKSRLICKLKSSDILAENSSTGEQKMMLLSIILSFIELVQQNKGTKPILLLDEINVHLDYENLHLVMDRLIKLKSQMFITTINGDIYGGFKDNVSFLYMN